MQTVPPPRGQCARCGVLYEARALRAHVEVCTGKAEWPGRGPKPRQAPKLSDGVLPPQPQQQLGSRGTCLKCKSVYVRQDLRGHAPHCNGKPAWPGAGPKPVVVAVIAPPVQAAAAAPPAAAVVPQGAPAVAASKSKGDCAGCGKHFDKGLHLHERSCAALKAKTAQAA